MNRYVVILAAAACAFPVIGQEHKLTYAKDGTGVFGYKDTPVQPWSGYRVHDPDRPAPKRVK